MLKPIDMVVLVGLTVAPEPMTQSDLARRLGVSQATVHRALKQLRASGLLHGDRPDGAALRRLLQHAVRNVYPPVPGPRTRGVSTGYVQREARDGGPREGWVWPDEDGDAYGPSVAPLHSSVPAASRGWPDFHDLMALVDTFRVGRARERRAALDRLDEILDCAP